MLNYADSDLIFQDLYSWKVSTQSSQRRLSMDSHCQFERSSTLAAADRKWSSRVVPGEADGSPLFEVRQVGSTMADKFLPMVV